MNTCLFFIAGAVSATRTAADNVVREAEALRAWSHTIPGVKRAVIHTPVQDAVTDPYLNDGAPPLFALQFYFDDISTLEATLLEDGAMQALLDPQRFALFSGCVIQQQVMAVRRFPVPAPGVETEGKSRCTYLVSYEGEAEDFSTWIGYYVDHHPRIMARFDGIREIEIYTRMDYRSAFKARRSSAMQRNKVVFDSSEALAASLHSPVRHEMREDFKHFPPYSGSNLHYPMISTAWTRA
jgi:hypothetical protein